MNDLALRRVEPEILDELAADDPRAVASRRDLSRINTIMGQLRIVAGILHRHLPAPPRRLLEIGCGDGSFMLKLARRLHDRWPQVEVLLLDRQRAVPVENLAALAALGWKARLVQADVLNWSEDAAEERFDVILANLFLHHFEDETLAGLFRRLAPRTCLFVASEPRRSRFQLMAAHMIGGIGANAVSRHDALLSVRAGFKGRELSALWPEARLKPVEERRRGPFTHVFVAAAHRGGQGSANR
ncbi:methyltransferase domain-containing protein [Afifella pfennigii]|uniref:methyltransferase domain-containing protein n=1 Tax=Afifella pfennigii TaxID=209897 RepID=UPI0005521C80|nr:methyltransferase domain-containing protein [Afifella pfennigii]